MRHALIGGVPDDLGPVFKQRDAQEAIAIRRLLLRRNAQPDVIGVEGFGHAPPPGKRVPPVRETPGVRDTSGVYLQIITHGKPGTTPGRREVAWGCRPALVATRARVITRFDRVFRSMEDFVTAYKLLPTQGVMIHILHAPGDPNTANGRAMLQLLCVFAEWSSRITSVSWFTVNWNS